jgi:hypothetical protein
MSDEKNYIVIYEDADDKKYFDRTNTTLKKITDHAQILKNHNYTDVEVYEAVRVW